MARYRIKQRPSHGAPGVAIFEVEKRCLWWWEYRGLYLSLEEAEERIEALQTVKEVETKIIKEYD